MVTVYSTAMRHSSWQNAWEFLGDCFELMYDAETPEEPVLVMKVSNQSGSSIKLYVDGDLFCRATFWTREGKLCGTLSWQGRSWLKNVSMNDFINKLNGKLDVYVKKSKSLLVAKKA